MMQAVEGARRPYARTIGIVYLLYFATAFLGAFLLKGLAVPGDAAATVDHILSHEVLYRSGFTVGLLANVIYIILAALLYGLFEPVSRNLSLVAAFLGLAGCAIQILGGVLQLAPLVILGDGQLSSAFKVEQVQAEAFLCLKLYSQVFSISLVVFALYDLTLGYLIFRSLFLPRILGALLMLAGVGWMTFVWPPLATVLSPYVLPLGALAEIALALWLVAKGVNTSRWQGRFDPAQLSA